MCNFPNRPTETSSKFSANIVNALKYWVLSIVWAGIYIVLAIVAALILSHIGLGVLAIPIIIVVVIFALICVFGGWVSGLGALTGPCPYCQQTNTVDDVSPTFIDYKGLNTCSSCGKKFCLIGGKFYPMEMVIMGLCPQCGERVYAVVDPKASTKCHKCESHLVARDGGVYLKQ